ncbi:hypothetical protein ACIRBZ_40235 [Streptomyces sp. NPDC094038]
MVLVDQGVKAAMINNELTGRAGNGTIQASPVATTPHLLRYGQNE